MTRESLRRGICAVVPALGVGAAVALVSPSTSAILIALIGIVLIAPIVVRAWQGRLDVLEPIVWLNVALIAIFVLHPAATLISGATTYRNRFEAIPETFNPALLIALAGVCAMYVGYFSPIHRRLTKASRPAARELDEDSLLIAAVAFTVLGVVLYGIAAVQTGVSILTLISGGLRANQYDTTAYLYLAPFMIIPAGLILMKVGVGRKRPSIAAAGIGLIVVLVNSLAPSGQRLWLLVIVASFAVYPILRTGWRPGVLAVAVILVLGFVPVASLRDLKPGGGPSELKAAVVRTVEHPKKALGELLKGPDTEMHSALALEMQFVPSETGFHPGHVTTSLLTHPIPRLLWPNKPYPMESILNSKLQRTVRAGDASAAYSVMGGFYYDSGVVGVMLGMFGVGLLFRGAWEWFMRRSTNDMARVIYALILPFTVILMRGNIPDTAARALFVIGPAVVAARFARREARARGVRPWPAGFVTPEPRQSG